MPLSPRQDQTEGLLGYVLDARACKPGHAAQFSPSQTSSTQVTQEPIPRQAGPCSCYTVHAPPVAGAGAEAAAAAGSGIAAWGQRLGSQAGIRSHPCPRQDVGGVMQGQRDPHLQEGILFLVTAQPSSVQPLTALSCAQLSITPHSHSCSQPAAAPS